MGGGSFPGETQQRDLKKKWGLEKNQHLVSIYSQTGNNCVILSTLLSTFYNKETACREHSHLARSLRTS